MYESSQVEYNARGFLEKNRDTLPQGVMEMLRKSDNTLISTIFAGNYTCLMPFRRKSCERLKIVEIFLYKGYSLKKCNEHLKECFLWYSTTLH